MRLGRMLVFLVATIPPCFAVSAARAAVTDDQAEAALAKAKKYLISKQLPSGRWEPDEKRRGVDHDWGAKQGDTWGGYTALCTYALLASGESHQAPHVANAVKFLKSADMIGTYAVAMRLQVWSLLPRSPEIQKAAKRDVDLLLSQLVVQGPSAGLWEYGVGRGVAGFPPGRIDHSISQYGVLGLWAGTELSGEVPKRVWAGMDKVWRHHQFPDGAWAYGSPARPTDGHGPSPSMTAAGVATLFILQDMLRGSGGGNCAGNARDEDIEQGLKWIGDHVDEIRDSYTWYGVERIGVASGYQYLGGHDWAELGTEALVKTQGPDGSWAGGYPGATPLDGTAFALVFLAHARAPVVLNKLDYRRAAPAPGADETAKPQSAAQAAQHPWNQRPRDAANLVRFTASARERFLKWQVVTLDSPVEDWHDVPILYIAGNKPLRFTPEDEAKLSQFAYEGGLILGNSDCPSGPADGFSQSFRALGAKLFKSEFRVLPRQHVLYADSIYNFAKAKGKPELEGLTNGVRELMLLMPQSDPARAWHANAVTTKADTFQLGDSVFVYTTGRQQFGRTGAVHRVAVGKPTTRPAATQPAATQPATTQPGGKVVKLARLRVGLNPDPEPSGWGRLAKVLREEHGVGLETAPVTPGGGELKGFTVAHLTGTTPFQLTAEQRAELSAFVAGGGTLVIDAAGGSTPFADAAEKELAAMFPGTKGVALPMEHEVFAAKGWPSAAIEAVSYRPYARTRLSGGSNAPRLTAFPAGADGKAPPRVSVFYSRVDLSAGLVGTSVNGIIGYAPQSATAIMRNIILYAATPR